MWQFHQVFLWLTFGWFTFPGEGECYEWTLISVLAIGNQIRPLALSGFLCLSADSVILEMSSLPVTAGDTVTLRCVYLENHSATPWTAFEAMFYKDDVFIGTEPTGERILRSVSKLDAGFYGCENPKAGKSPVSWLTVRGNAWNWEFCMFPV